MKLISREQEKGLDPYNAIVISAISRFRPISLTTITTVLGVMPLIVTVDPLFYSLACIIAVELAIGTVLTLGIVPMLYALLFLVNAPS